MEEELKEISRDKTEKLAIFEWRHTLYPFVHNYPSELGSVLKNLRAQGVSTVIITGPTAEFLEVVRRALIKANLIGYFPLVVLDDKRSNRVKQGVIAAATLNGKNYEPQNIYYFDYRAVNISDAKEFGAITIGVNRFSSAGFRSTGE